MTTVEYAIKYGGDSLSSQEYRDEKARKMTGCNNPNYENFWSDDQKKNLSEKRKGSIPHNKGKKVTDTDVLARIKAGIESREKKYADGELIRPSYDITDEIKSKISIGVKKYADDHRDEMSARAKKAAATKYANGHSGPMLGKKHDDEAKRKISVKSKETWAIKKEEIKDSRRRRMESYGYEIIKDDDVLMLFNCVKCGTANEFHPQYADECRINDKMCIKCHPRYLNRSLCQTELFEFITKICPDAIYNYQGWSGKNEIDIFIPSKNIGFEYNGIYWHSQKVLEGNGLSKTRDFEKFNAAKASGVRIYTIFEDEYKYKKDIVLDRIKTILGAQVDSVYARKCKIEVLDSKRANVFINENHIQGVGRSNYRLGLYNGEDLVAVMTFSNKEISRKLAGWEINRFACKKNTIVVGGAGKLFAHFIKEMNPGVVISYADTRWSDGNLYSKLGFTLDSQTVPNYWYFKGSNAVRIHRYTMRKTKDDKQGLTEYENRLLAGYDRVYDCGSSKWIWTDK